MKRWCARVGPKSVVSSLFRNGCFAAASQPEKDDFCDEMAPRKARALWMLRASGDRALRPQFNEAKFVCGQRLRTSQGFAWIRSEVRHRYNSCVGTNWLIG